MYRLDHTLPAAGVKSTDYAAIYFPGGSANMFETPFDTSVHRLVREVYERDGGVVGAVCHGTGALTQIELSDGRPLVAGKRITGFPTRLERAEAPYFKAFPFTITEAVRANGGEWTDAEEMGSGYFVADGRVVTGMDNSATRAVAAAMVEELGREL